jgi:mRNA-degrading endonuclease RelE of RelBE toxin-antitoxin system
MIEILYTNRFKKDLKRIFKKNWHIRGDVDDLIHALHSNPGLGTPLGKNCYKIRLKDSSSSKGKSGGYWVITYLREKNEKITLLTIYTKSEKSTLTDEELKAILQDIQ